METVIADDVDRRRAFEGAKRLLLRCVSLCEGDVLALFWDHTTEEPAALRLRAAEELGMSREGLSRLVGSLGLRKTET